MAASGLLAGFLGACVAPGRMAGAEFVVTAKGYRVVPPAGWRRIPSDADLALRRAAGPAGLMVHGSCEGSAPGRSLAVLARHLRFGLRDVRDLSETPAELAGHAAVRTAFVARLDGAPVAVTAVTLRAEGCAYDLVIVAPPEVAAQVAGDFERLVASFQLIESRR
jgi:hypothetical protein